MALSDNQNDILALFNLEPEDVEDVTSVTDGKQTIVHILLRANYPPCPDCENKDVHIKGYELKKINYGILLCNGLCQDLR